MLIVRTSLTAKYRKLILLPCVACTTQVSVSISFGGKSWPIDPTDMNLGTVGSNLCLGGIFDLNLGSSVTAGGGNPSWVVGDTFLVSLRIHFLCHLASPPCHLPQSSCSVSLAFLLIVCAVEKRLLRVPCQPTFDRLRTVVRSSRRFRSAFNYR